MKIERGHGDNVDWNKLYRYKSDKSGALSVYGSISTANANNRAAGVWDHYEETMKFINMEDSKEDNG